MDEIAQRMAQMRWTWADKDPEALAILEGRIAATGRHQTLIPYSDLVAGSRFTSPI
jgi:hypothetical protein